MTHSSPTRRYSDLRARLAARPFLWLHRRPGGANCDPRKAPPRDRRDFPGIYQMDRARSIAPHQLLNRSEEHTSELQSTMRISYDVFCLKNKKKTTHTKESYYHTHHTIHKTN